MLQGKSKPELLAPAGDLDRLKIALFYGADAVYAGAPDLSLRAKTKFPLEDLKEGIAFAHALNRKVYLALNFFSRNGDEERLKSFVEALDSLKPDGVIVADGGVLAYIKEALPALPLHISTQANVGSSLSARFWQKQGAALCVLGRETSLAEAAQIKADNPGLKLEIFVHGAMCMSYSGRCLLSAFMAGRGANQGQCAHSCRWKYKSKLLLEEEKRPGSYLVMEEDERGSYIFNSKDLCMMPHLKAILEMGMDSLKIEGRNKSAYYVGAVTRVYRQAIDCWCEDPQSFNSQPYFEELQTLQNRGYTQGFAYGMPKDSAQNYESAASDSQWRAAGIARGYEKGMLRMEIKHKLTMGDTVEFLRPDKLAADRYKIEKLYNPEDGSAVPEFSAGVKGRCVWLPVNQEQQRAWPAGTLARIKIKACNGLF